MNTPAFNTLQAVNDRLHQLNLGDLSPEQAAELKARTRKEHVCRALATAQTNPNAMRWLESTIAHVRTGAASGAAESLPPPRQARGPAQTQTQTRPQLRSVQAGPHSPMRTLDDVRNGQPGATAQRVNAPATASSPASAKPAATESPKTAQPVRFRPSFHVYGGRAALTFEEGTTPKQDDHTVFVDGARGQNRTYEWDSKIRFMFTPKELLKVLAVVIGATAKVKLDSHGPQKNKYLSVEHQGSKLYWTMGQGKDLSLALPIEGEDAFAIAAMLTKQIRRNYDSSLDNRDILTLVGRVVGRMQAAKQGQ